MEQQRVVRDAEEYLQHVVAEVMAPHPAECVLCYVARMLDEHGCDETLRWAGRFRELRSPRATALESRMQAAGGFCDCEVFSNGYRLRREHLERDGQFTAMLFEVVGPEPRRAGEVDGAAGVYAEG